jgi:hypothetical protein
MIDASTRCNSKLWLSGLFCLAIGLRVAALVMYSDNLLDDRDAYLNLARHLSAGEGFSTTGKGPTAYRPPLYPALLSLGGMLFSFESETTRKSWVAGVNLCCSLLTIWVLWRTMATQCSRVFAYCGTLLIAVNPLLIYNVTLPMTETLCALLVVCFVNSLLNTDGTIHRQGMVGFWFGLCVLCRPTLWAFAGIWLSVTFLRCLRSGEWKQSVRRSIPSIVMTSLVMAPWILRNAVAFGTFIPMTTHGGYTLLLANNEVFYSEVVDVSWRETWKGESLSRWQTSLERQLKSDFKEPISETERSRWMTRQAIDTMRRQPTTFLKSCGVRFLRFWNLVPLSAEGRATPRLVALGMIAYGAMVYLGMLLSIRQLGRSRLALIGWCLIAAFAAVHLMYWSNLRMRAPLEPVIVMLAVLGTRSWSLHKQIKKAPERSEA